MALAAFPLIIKRWNRSYLFSSDYAQYTQLAEYLPEPIFLARIEALNLHVLKGYPHIWLDTFLFFFAICIVIGTAAISIIAHVSKIPLWYPLVVLFIPAFIAFYTTRRRNRYYKRLIVYYESLQAVIKEFNSLDVTRQIKWSFRRLRDTDTPASFHLDRILSKRTINFVIEIIQINTENEMMEEGEHLPAYDTSQMDVILDVGPEVERTPGNISGYIIQSPQTAMIRQEYTIPPAYVQESGPVEMSQIHPPPAYLNVPVTNTH